MCQLSVYHLSAPSSALFALLCGTGTGPGPSSSSPLLAAAVSRGCWWEIASCSSRKAPLLWVPGLLSFLLLLEEDHLLPHSLQSQVWVCGRPGDVLVTVQILPPFQGHCRPYPSGNSGSSFTIPSVRPLILHSFSDWITFLFYYPDLAVQALPS